VTCFRSKEKLAPRFPKISGSKDRKFNFFPSRDNILKFWMQRGNNVLAIEKVNIW
jgi:hypothetical protein